MNTSTLTVRRKADRAQMAARVAALATSYGVVATVRPEPTFLGPRATAVEISHGDGARLDVWFDGAEAVQDSFVLSWFMGSSSDQRYSDTFGMAVNPVHRHKATEVCSGFDDLMDVLQYRFAMLADGSAYERGK